MTPSVPHSPHTHPWRSALVPAALGSLLVAATTQPLTDAAGPSPFLLRATDARVTISGPIAHVEVTQTWENPNAAPVDGLYVFPLPENAAVTDMSLRIGSRVIRGEMRRREEARALYEQARREGRVAGLLDQERSNVFAQQVANLMPGARIDVLLSFDHEVACEDGDCEYVFPTVVGPRFVPRRQGDPGRINPPVAEPGTPTGQRLTLRIDLDGAVSIHDVGSPSHRVTVVRDSESRARVTLADEQGAALDKDVRLRWRLGSDAPEMGLLTTGGFFTVILQPPREIADDDAAPRELVFLLDCSGSMSGVPIEAAKGVVRRALGAVRLRDTLQIIRFSDSASGLARAPIPATPENVRRALAYLEGLHGEGGTEMISGIRAALGYAPDPERLRIVAFLTDGYIGNESEILGEVRRLLGSARLFSFGIGSSVNRYLLESLAEEGRGAAAFLAPRESPDDLVRRFVERIATPVLTDVRLTWDSLEVEDQEPATPPDLFAGQPLVVHGRYLRPGAGLLTLEGTRRGRPFTLRRVVALPDRAADHEAIARLWARARIHRLMREMHDGDLPSVREAVVALGLEHRVMTAWTSLVAVDSEVSNSTGIANEVQVPVDLPEDVSREGIFGVARARGVISLASPPPAPAAKGFFEALGAGSRDGAPRAPIHGVRFDRLTLVRPDGSRLVVEEDGEVWAIAGQSRRLAKALAAQEIEALRAALATARPGTWPAGAGGTKPGGVGPRLVFEAGGTWSAVSLPATDAAVTSLVRLLESYAR
jgi:Ca-activated chloride channel family protein